MTSSKNSLVMLAAVARRFGPMLDDVVFLGGAVGGLLLDSPLSGEIRATDDVDVIVEVATYREFSVVQENLRALGFSHSRDEDDPICRFIVDGIKVDVMPINGDVLGFKNVWYEAAFTSAQNVQIEDDLAIKIVTAPCFVATKLDAFQDRGDNDYFTSYDIEDVITLVNGRSALVDEIRTASTDVRAYIAEQFDRLMADPSFEEAISAHLLPDAASQARKSAVMDRMRQIAALRSSIE